MTKVRCETWMRRIGRKMFGDEMRMLAEAGLIEHCRDGLDKRDGIFDDNDIANFSFG